MTPNENPVGATVNVDATNPQFDNEVDGDGTTVNLTGSGINEVTKPSKKEEGMWDASIKSCWCSKSINF